MSRHCKSSTVPSASPLSRTGLKHRAWRFSCRARHNVECDRSSELCRRSTLRVCRGVSVTATSNSANTSVIRRRFSGRDSSGAHRRRCLIFVLMLSRPVWPQCTHLAWFSALLEPLAQLSNVLRWPVNATTHGCKSCKHVRDQKNDSKNCLSNHHPSS